MKHLSFGAAAALLSAGGANAGGVERSTQSISFLFESGNYAEVSFGTFDPSITGTSSFPFGVTSTNSGRVIEGYPTYSLGYKHALTENIDLAIIVDQAIGADVDYPKDTGYPLAGTTADLDNNALTALLRYRFPSNVSLIGGLRALRSSGEVYIPLPSAFGPVDYDLKTSTETDFGYILGIAWEKPEIAARVSLTYNSAITHDFESSERLETLLGPMIVDSTFETEVPESINLEFQTGVAADTLLFGSIRWVNWTDFVIAPELYIQPSVVDEPLVYYDDDTITYNLGLGRKFNDTWSGAVLMSYEEGSGNLTGNLGPTDGFTSAGVALTYTRNKMKITGGVRYVDIGGVDTRGVDGKFHGNHGWGAGIRVGYSF